MTLAPADAPETVARVHEGMPLVEVLGRQLQRQLGSHIELGDLLSAGHEGLLHAARSFDASLGVPFRRWANLRIRGAMLDAMRRQGILPRRVYQRIRAIEAGDRMTEVAIEEDAQRPATSEADADTRLGKHLAGIATAMAVGLLSPTAGPDPEDVRDTTLTAEELFSERELLSKVRAAVDKQPEAERHLLVRHYFDGVTFEQAAAELKLSKSWASRLHARAIEALALELRSVLLKELE